MVLLTANLFSYRLTVYNSLFFQCFDFVGWVASGR